MTTCRPSTTTWVSDGLGMTFEEFFAKKKIDLTQLSAAKPMLYEEFREHYALMGEKSFDHTKKYWFNRLRKDYLLKAVGMPVERLQTVAVEAPKQALASSPAESRPEETSKPSATAPKGFKPRFRPNATDEAKPESQPLAMPPEAAPETPEIAPATKPMGFKPRFKAGMTGVAKPENTGTETPAPQPESPTTEKPAPPAPPTPTPETPEIAPATKPMGFKPRFKAGVTGVAKPESTKGETPAPQPESPPTEKPAPPAPPTPTPEASEPAPAAKPLGFKPRFKPGVTDVKKKDNPEE